MEYRKEITTTRINELYQQTIEYLQNNKLNDAEQTALYLIKILPTNSDLLNCLGRIYQFKGNFKESIVYLNKAIISDPENTLAYYNLGIGYILLKDLNNAKDAFTNYIEYTTEDGDKKYIANLYISKLHFDLLDIEETKYYYIASRHPLFQQFSKLLIPRMYKSMEELKYYRKEYEDTLDYLIENYKKYQILDRDEFLQYSGFTYCYGFPLSYQGISNKLIYQKQCQMYRLIYPLLNYTSKYINNYKTKSVSDKIHIGFISTNFFNQSVTRDRMGVIRNLPRDKFEVTVFYYFKPDDDLGRFIWDSDNNNIILPDSNVLERRNTIEEQKLDVLVYCDIGMAPDTQWLAYSRLASIQLNTWGHSDTSGIDTIDYYMSSSFYEEDWSQENYSEQLVRLNSLCTYYFKIITNPEYVTKDYFNIDNSKKLYLCCQTLFKINPSYDTIINKILDKDPNAIYAFIDMSVGKYIQTQLIDRLKITLGDKINRVIFMPWQDEEHNFYKVLSCADVILDSVPFGGCNTSFSALGMGLPIVTYPGNLINGRFTLGMYRKMGIEELVVYNETDYINKAYQIANDIDYRTNISKKILEHNHLIFNEVDSITTWSESIQEFYHNLDKSNILKPIQKQSIQISNNSFRIPYIFHFIFFGYTTFEYIHYLSIKTCYDNNPDATIYLYNTAEPVNNNWWNNIKKYIKLIQINPPENIFGNILKNYAHKADIIRLEKLIEFGGIYLDIDVLTIKSFKEIIDNATHGCIMGLQATNTQYEGLCNATIIAQPQSEFLIKWYDNYKTFNCEEWDNHSVHLPKRLAMEYPEIIQCYDNKAFFPISWWFSEKYKLFAKDSKYDNILNESYSIHVWETKWKDTLNNITPEYMLETDNLFTKTFKKHVSNNNLQTEDKNILYIGSTGNSGYSISAKGYIKSLLSLEYNIKFKSFRNEHRNTDDNDNILLQQLEKNIIDYNTIICHTLPSFWNLFKENGKTFIGVFVWETNNIPLEWIENIKLADKIITPSKFNYELLLKYNSNIYYVPHLIENINVNSIKSITEICKLEKKYDNIYLESGTPFKLTNELIDDNTFIYYVIGTYEIRKNIDQLINIYSQLNMKNIVLYIKSNLWTNNDINTILSKFKYCTNPIIFNFDNVNIIDIYNIHKKCNCFVSTAYSEGVGLSIIQAAYYKNTVIFNKFGGTIEYIPYGNSISSVLETAIDINNPLFNNNNQQWAKMDDSEILNSMKNIYNKNESYLINIDNNYKHIINNFDIYNIANKFKTVLKKNTINTEIIKQINKQYVENVEILIIGELDILKDRMDKNIYKFLVYLKNNSKYNITFISPKSEHFKIGMNIHEVISTYCLTSNPIIYTTVYDKVDKCIISGLNTYTGVKIFDLEDIYEYNNLINCMNIGKYNYAIYKYNCEQQDYIINHCKNIQFYRMPHFINEHIFNINSHVKTIDILLYGNDNDFYPFRQRLFKLIKNSDIKYYELPFPGYGDELNPCTSEPVIEKSLSSIINSAKFTICTCSVFEYSVKKYFESALCGSVIIGNIPTKDNDIFDNNLIQVNDSMADDKIINIIKDSIEKYESKYIQDMRQNMYSIVNNNYIYKNGCEKFDKFIDYLNINKLNNK
jgi:predicted O-linked N-acetylglucosamine transferase (SPINDLY family)